ncbi:MAG TPA: hypothetical protein VEJ86_06300 [Candidatus Binataceae bacterium]|nr:hypothetical protein [Candidatus Binataceae bacterium]
MAALLKPLPLTHPTDIFLASSPPATNSQSSLEFSGVFRGHELTRKDRRLASGVAPLDVLLGGGIARGRVSEIIGARGSGRTSLAASFVASTTRRTEVAAWIDGAASFDPASLAGAGVDLRRVLWVAAPSVAARSARPMTRESRVLKAAEVTLEAGGFGLVVVDFGDEARWIPQSAALRLARAAERSGAAVVVIASRRMCGTFAVLSLVTHRVEAAFSRLTPRSPAIFDGLIFEAEIARNKLGGLGRRARLEAVLDYVAFARSATGESGEGAGGSLDLATSR